MDIPVGALVEENVSISEVNVVGKISSLLEEGFTGYAVVNSEGKAGIEEGLVLLKEGFVTGAVYEYISLNKIVYNASALNLLLNASLSKFGVMDVGKLSRQQVELIIAFNDKIELDTQVDAKAFGTMVPKKFDSDTAEKEIKEELQKKESKFDIFKKIGLGGLSR